MENHKNVFAHDERVNYSFFKLIDENEVKTGFNSENQKEYQGEIVITCLRCHAKFGNETDYDNHKCEK
jgi:hypothetical protein